MKACAPKTKKTAKATSGLRGEREREVRERLDDQPGPHDVAEADALLEPPVGHHADEAADGHRGREQPEADVAHAEPLGGVEHEHRPGGAEGHVEADDRQGQRAYGGVVPQPPHALDDVAKDVLRLGRSLQWRDASCGTAGGADSTRSTRLRDEGQRHAGGEESCPDRRAGQLVGDDDPGSAGARWRCRSRRFATTIGIRVAYDVSANVSAVPSRKIAASTIADLHGVGHDRGDQHDEDHGAQASAVDHDAVAGRAGRRARRRTGRRAATAAAEAVARHRDEERVGVCDATSSGAAAMAMPSPRLLDPGRCRQPAEAACPGVRGPGLREPAHSSTHKDKTLTRGHRGVIPIAE